MSRESIKFNGRNYSRWSKSKSNPYFYNGTLNSYLHRDIWEFHFGKIPKGHHIHHKDGNKSNNDISNLECLSAIDHFRGHFKAKKKEKSFCENCGSPMEKVFARKRLCSKACKANARFHKGIDNVERKCVMCNSNFLINRYSKTKTCSGQCRGRYISLRMPKGG